MSLLSFFISFLQFQLMNCLVNVCLFMCVLMSWCMAESVFGYIQYVFELVSVLDGVRF